MNSLVKLVLILILVSSCSYLADPPREDGDGKIDTDQIKRDIDIDLGEYCRIDVEKERILCECRVSKWWCI